MTLLERRRMLMGRKVEPEEWDYVFLPNENGMIVPSVTLRANAGQTVTISWKTSVENLNAYTNRYVWRCVGAKFDGASSGYIGLTMAGAREKKDTRVYSVTGGGNFLVGGYGIGQEGTAFIGDYLKVRIE